MNPKSPTKVKSDAKDETNEELTEQDGWAMRISKKARKNRKKGNKKSNPNANSDVSNNNMNNSAISGDISPNSKDYDLRSQSHSRTPHGNNINFNNKLNKLNKNNKKKKHNTNRNNIQNSKNLSSNDKIVNEIRSAIPEYTGNIDYIIEVVRELNINSFNKNNSELRSKINDALIEKLNLELYSEVQEEDSKMLEANGHTLNTTFDDDVTSNEHKDELVSNINDNNNNKARKRKQRQRARQRRKQKKQQSSEIDNNETIDNNDQILISNNDDNNVKDESSDHDEWEEEDEEDGSEEEEESSQNEIINNNNNNNNSNDSKSNLNSIDNDSNNKQSSKNKKVPTKPIKKLNEKEKFEKELKSLNLESRDSRLIMQEWIHSLKPSNNFCKLFYEFGGIETIIEKIVYSSENEIVCNSELNQLFDLTLQGSKESHRALIHGLCELSNKIVDCGNEQANVRDIVIKQIKRLCRAQVVPPSPVKKDIPRDNIVLPSDAIALPNNNNNNNSNQIVSSTVVESLDSKALELSEIFHKLKCEEYQTKMLHPTIDDSFHRTFKKVKDQIRQNMQVSQHRKSEVDHSLQRIQDKLKQIQNDIHRKTANKQNRLNELETVQKKLEFRKNEIEKELLSINSQLAENARHCMTLKAQIKKVKNETAKQVGALEAQKNHHLFSVHSFRTSYDTFEKLNNLIQENCDQLIDWSHKRNSKYFESQNNVAQRYLEHLKDYLLDCAKMHNAEGARITELRELILNSKSLDEATRRLIGGESIIHGNDEKIRNLTEHIDIAERTKHSIVKHIELKLKESLKCKAYVHSHLFHSFILDLHNLIGNEIDLSNYVSQAKAFERSMTHGTNLNNDNNNNNNNNSNNDSNNYQQQRGHSRGHSHSINSLNSMNNLNNPHNTSSAGAAYNNNSGNVGKTVSVSVGVGGSNYSQSPNNNVNNNNINKNINHNRMRGRPIHSSRHNSMHSNEMPVRRPKTSISSHLTHSTHNQHLPHNTHVPHNSGARGGQHGTHGTHSSHESSHETSHDSHETHETHHGFNININNNNNNRVPPIRNINNNSKNIGSFSNLLLTNNSAEIISVTKELDKLNNKHSQNTIENQNLNQNGITMISQTHSHHRRAPLSQNLANLPRMSNSNKMNDVMNNNESLKNSNNTAMGGSRQSNQRNNSMSNKKAYIGSGGKMWTVKQ